jgi:hypothetical protein
MNLYLLIIKHVLRGFSSSSSHRSKSSSATPLSLQNISLSDDDDFFSEEVPPSAKRTKKSPTLCNLSDESSNDRVASPVIGGPKRAQRPVQLSKDAFTVVNKQRLKNSFCYFTFSKISL